MPDEIFYIAYRILYWGILGALFAVSVIEGYKVLAPYFRVFRALPHNSKKFILRTGAGFAKDAVVSELKKEIPLLILAGILFLAVIALNLVLVFVPVK
ncbi:MAG: hypothetical protein A2Y33_09100 [Spirochaetes bacterium GWF1_51_8]|nr:MAG: hypothetical protein A2Y33_09100 [Spirochaetes bacterium GWF1_51_8]